MIENMQNKMMGMGNLKEVDYDGTYSYKLTGKGVCSFASRHQILGRAVALLSIPLDLILQEARLLGNGIGNSVGCIGRGVKNLFLVAVHTAAIAVLILSVPYALISGEGKVFCSRIGNSIYEILMNTRGLANEAIDFTVTIISTPINMASSILYVVPQVLQAFADPSHMGSLNQIVK